MINYYGPRQNWTKWLGVTLGGIFATIAIGSGFLILRLTRSPNAAPMAALATAPLPGAAPVAAPPPPVATPGTAGKTATPSPVSPDSRHHSRHHDHGKNIAAEQAKSAEPGTAKKSASAASASAPNTIGAGHDSKEKRPEKDELDKLLGM